MLRFKWLVLFLVLCLGLGACKEKEQKQAQENKPVQEKVKESEKSEAAPQPKVVPVKILEIRGETMSSVVEVVGRLAADREVTLSAEVGGTVQAYYADLGDAVKEGQVLVDVDPKDYELGLREAQAGLASVKARLDTATLAYKRGRKLLSQEVISKDTFDKLNMEYKAAMAAAQQAKARLDIAEEKLKKVKIRAPFDGHVAGRMVEEGQMVGFGAPVMTLVDLTKMRVNVHVAEGSYVRLKQGDPIQLKVEAFPHRFFPGRIDRLGVKADSATNTFVVEIQVDNPSHTLKAGLTTRVQLTTDVLPGAILIPQSAVLYRGDKRVVFLAGPDGRAMLKEVQLGEASGTDIQIREGLNSRDRLIVSGGQYLKAGDRISITEVKQIKAP